MATWNSENITPRELPPVRATWAPALKVRYLGPTEHRGSRVKASWLDGNRDTVTLSMDYSLSVAENEDRAAQTLVQRRLDVLEATTAPLPGLRWRLLRGNCSADDIFYLTEKY